MATYTFMWNPTKDEYSFQDYERVRERALAGSPYVTKWICRSKSPTTGDVAYMYRTGKTNNGIFARGTVSKPPMKKPGGKRHLTLRLDEFLPLGLEISRKTVVEVARYPSKWQPQASGEVIHPELVDAIEEIWSLNSDIPIAQDIDITPDRVTSVISRIIRDTGAVIALKSKYEFRCQICNETLPYGKGLFYAEAHHLRPLGSPHNGPDDESNMLVLCPNHHALFDLSVPRFVSNSTVKINGTRYKLNLRHKIATRHIKYYMSSMISK